ncbi:IL23R protein, partial [Smithornis capensis]|nr:IL23R protein [Smithornis capensis]
GCSVKITFPVKNYGKHTYLCKSLPPKKQKIFCGIDIKCGNPPDEPGNLSCIQIGRDGHPICSWDRGRPTYIHTTYVIQ